MTKNLQNLFLIGGGVMRNEETVNLDKWLIKKAKRGTNKPKVLFVPTASQDLPVYITDFTNRYTSYGSQVDVLLLASKHPALVDVRNKILTADLIYFGGGNMDFAFEKFNKYKMESILDQAAQKGILIGGLSAGAAMFGDSFLDFEWDGTRFANFKLNDGYGWINYTIWTHFSSGFLKKKKIISALKGNQEILGIGDGVLVYWDQNNTMKMVANSDDGVCVLGNFLNSQFSLKPAPKKENVNRNI